MTQYYQAGVIGFPIHHSLSPKLHGYWLDKYGINGNYTAIPVEPGTLKNALFQLREKGWRGCNVTLPHKEDAYAICDELDENAKRIKAVNTIIFGDDGKIYGSNTDAYGFSTNLMSQCTPKPNTGCAIVLGAGGACRAIIVALMDMGFTHIHLINRTIIRASDLASEFTNENCNITSGDFESVYDYLENCALLVNTTSLGMSGQMDLNIDLTNLPTTSIVTDIVYNPLMTTLLETAKERGNTVVDGLGMLLYQAVPGFKVWFNHDNPQVTDELRNYILGEMGL